MGALKSSKNQALLAGETKNAQEKEKQRGNENKNIDFKPKEKQNPSEGASGSKKDNHKRFDQAKYSDCKRGNHPENLCMKKTIDEMSILLEQNNISLPEGIRNLDHEPKTEDYEIFHALKASFS